MKKFILPILISLAPLFLKAQPLACDIQINGVSFITYDLCVGEDVTLNGTPTGGTLPYTHLWSGGGSQLSPTNNNPTVFTATTPGTYTITYTVTDAVSGNCSDQIVITVNPLPNLFTSKNDTVCLGECTNLTAVTFTGDALYWYPGYIGNPVGDTSCTGCSSLLINVCPTSDTDYYAMTVIATTGCIRTKKVSIEVCNLTVAVTGSPNPICKNDTSCLTATPSGCGPTYSYVWSPATNIDNPNIANPCVWPTTNTNYCVTITDNLTGCTADTCFMVTVNPQNPPTITPPQDTICYGACITLTASGSGTIWNWSNGGTTASINVCDTVTTVYTVTMTDASGCTATASATITVNPQLFAEAGANDSICYGQCTAIGGSPAGWGGTAPYTYGWSPAAGLSSSTAANPQACPTATTTYVLTVTDAAGCTATDNVTITVNPQIIITITPTPPSLCLGGCSNLTTTVSGGTPGYTYQWSPCGSLNNCTIQSPLACPNITTIYTLTVTDSKGCTESATATVTVNVPPTAEAGNDQTICSGQTVPIGGSPTASGGTSPYTYQWSPATGLSCTTCANPNANPTSTTTYCVTVTDANSCSASDCVTITVNPSPTANAGADQIMCQGNCVAIGGAPTASGGTPGYNYNWSPAGSLNSSTIANPTACPLTTTTYCVTVTDALGCTASDCVTITVNTATATAVANPASICLGACSNIMATGGGTYQWSSPPGGTTPTINVCPTSATTYTVTVTAVNGCTAVASATVSVDVLTVTATATTNPLCPPACTNLTANPSGIPPYTYQWSNPPGGTTQTVNVCPTTTTTYTVTVTDANSCSQSASVTVNVYTATASATPNPICSGQCTTISATGGGTYAWNTGQTIASFIVCPTSTTTYTVTVTNGGCTTTASVTVNVTAVTGVAAPLTIPICLGNCTTINLTPSGGVAPYTYAWSPAAGLSSTTVQNPQACPTATTTYTCTITDANGCAGTATTTVTVITASVIGNPTSVCTGDTAMLVAIGCGTYQWSTPPGGTNDTVYVAPTTTTTYTVTVNCSGCTASANFTVTVGAFTVTATANPANICAGGGTPVTLGASMGSTYSWVSAPNDPSLAGQTTLQNPVVTPTVTTTYTVTVTSSGGCTATASVTVNVDNLNATASASPNAVCAGECTTISVNIIGGQAPYTYAWCSPPGGNTSSITVCPTVTTSYCVTITDALGCTDLANVTVTALPLPVITITPDQSICVGGTAQIVSSSPTGVSCSWTASPNDPSLAGQQNNCTINISPTVNTTYCVTITDGNGCSASVCSIVTVISNPVACINPSQTSICSGDSVTLNSCLASTYSWSSSPNDITMSCTNCQNPVATPATTTTYTVTVTQTGCTTTAVATATITVVPQPIVSLSSSPPSLSICAGTCVTFTASGVASSYNFVVNNISQQTGGSNIYTTCALTDPSSVYVVATNGALCSDTSNVITINVNPVPTVTIPTVIQPSFCGACDGSLCSNVIGGTLPYVSYQWDDPSAQTTPCATNLCAGSYIVVVTDSRGCTAQGTAGLSDPGSPLITLSASDDSICVGDCITFTATGTAVTFDFQINGGTMQAGASNIFTYCSFSNGDVVAVLGTDTVGCTGTSNSIPISVDPLPTQFSITGGLPFCNGGCSNIGLNGSAAGVSYYLYMDSIYVGPTVPGTNNPISFGCVTDTGDYTIIAQQVLTGCQNMMFGWVHPIENPLPTLFTVTGGGTMCADSSGVLIGLNGSQILSDSISYQIIIDGVTQDTTIIGSGGAISFGNWNIQGTYQIVATNIVTTCSDTMNGSAVVNVIPIPAQCTVTGGGSYCAGGIGVFVGLSCSDSTALYQLYNNSGPVGLPTPGNGSALNFGLQTQAGDYWVVAISGACSSNMLDTVTVTINPAPAINAGIDATICEGSQTQLNATGGISYVWSPTNDIIANPWVSPVVTTTYTVTGTDINGCTNTDNVIITVWPFTYPQITTADSVFCSYETVNTVLDAGAGYSSYTWSNPPGGTTQTITVTAAGCYSVSVSAANGCSASDQICVVQNPPMPPAVILAAGPTTFCEPDSVELYLNNPYYTYDWSSGSENESSIFVLDKGSYYVTVTDSFGCRDTAGPMVINVDPLPHAIISYVDQGNAQLEFDFYNNSLYSTTAYWEFGDSGNSNQDDVIHYYPSTGNYTVILTVTNNCGSDTDTVVVVVHQPYSGLTDNSGIVNFDLYPNPTKDIINMDFTLGDAEKVTFSMYDALGQQMIYDESDYLSGEQHKELSLAGLSKGVYVLKVNTDKGSFIRRVIKD